MEVSFSLHRLIRAAPFFASSCPLEQVALQRLLIESEKTRHRKGTAGLASVLEMAAEPAPLASVIEEVEPEPLSRHVNG